MKVVWMLFCFFCASVAFAQKEPDLSKFKTSKEKLQAWANYCDAFLSVENYQKLRAVAKKGIAMTPKTDYYNQSLFTFYIGTSFDYGTETDSISHYLEKSEQLARLAHNNNRVVQALKSLIICYKNYGYTSKRERVLKELQHVIDTSKNGLNKSKLFQEISDYYISIGHYEIGLQNLLEGIKGRKLYLSKGDFNDTINYGVQLVNAAELFVTMQNLPKGLDYLRESEPYIQKYKEGVAAVHKDFISIYLKQNELPSAQKRYQDFNAFLKTTTLSDCFEYLIESDLLFADYYLNQKKNSQALFYANHAKPFTVQHASDFTKAQVNQMFGKIYLQQKQYSKALPFLLTVEPIIKEDSPESNSNLQKLLADTYAGMGNTAKAYFHMNAFSKLQETLLAEKAKKNLAEMEAKYQNNNKKQEIATLSAQNTIKNLEINNATRQKWYLIFGILSLGIIGSLLFYQSQNRKKVNEKLQLLNTELDQANKTKTRFFSILNHDLRSPVSNLIHFLHLQKESPELLDSESKQRLENKTIAGAENLLTSMEDILLWSKGQMENFEPKIKMIAIASIFKDIQNHFESEEKIKIRFENFDDIAVATDENYLKTIMRNLTGNAIKALGKTENPCIIWKAWQVNEKSYLSITDNGPGGSQEQFKALYDETEVVGIKSGLGFHLIRDLAIAIDCKIEVKTKANKGTTFVLSLA